MNKFNSLALIFLTSVLLFSCGRKKVTTENTNNNNNATFPITGLIPAETGSAEQGDWIIRHVMSDAEKINPIVTNDATASAITLYIFENLLEIDRVTYELTPLIAKSMPVVSDDHLSYTFDLKENVTFSDGVPLTCLLYTSRCV